MEDDASPERDIFYSMLGVTDPSQRRSLLDSLCAGDLALRQRVEGLLAAHDGDALNNAAGSSIDVSSREVELQPGQTIGRFKLLEKIGEGGFGVVYMADQMAPVQRRVALKIIKAGMDTKQVIGRFESERQALALLDHPNIAKVFDAGATDTGRSYFVMELVRGIPITDYCDQHALSTEDRLDLFQTVCSSIQHAHQKGIIHRDIKPSNILVAHDGDRPVAKVIDFGIAKATQGRLTDKTLFTQFNQLLGTPAYMSPEQAQMTNVDVDTRSDIYSLGVLLYELLIGTTPFDSRDLQEAGLEEMCRRIREVEPATPSTRLSGLSIDQKITTARLRRAQQVELMHTVRGELDWIVMKSLEKNRARRYETADALKLDIQRFLSHEPVMAAAPSATYRASKFIHRNKKAIIVAGLFGLLLAVGTVISTWQAIRATRQTIRATAAEHSALENLNLANSNLQLAKENALASRRNQYAVEMMLAQSSTSGLSSENVYELLKGQIPLPGEQDFRGFEWRWLWNNTHRRQLLKLEGHTDEIRSVSMSPDGRWLASGSTDGTAKLWDIIARRAVWSCSEGEHCNHVEFSPDGRLLATKWWNPKGANSIVWNASDPTRMTKLREFASFGGFSPDGETAISSGEPLTQWNFETGDVRHIYSDFAFEGTEYAGRSHQSGRLTTTFSADGLRLLTVGEDRAIKLWDTNDGSLLLKINADTEVFDGAFSPVNETIATVSIDVGLVQIWNGQGEEIHQIRLDNPLDRVRFSMDGKKLIVSERFGRIHVYETRTWEELAAFDSRGSMKALRLSSTIDPNVVVTASEINLTNTIRFWDIASKETVLEHALPVRTLQFSHDGTMLAVGMVNGAVKLWDVAKRSAIFTTTATRTIGPDFRERPALTSYRPGFVQFSPDDQTIAIMGPPDTITIWRIDERQPAIVVTVPSDSRRLMSLSFSPTGKTLYAGSFGSGVVRWDLAQPDRPTTLEHPGEWSVDCLAWAPDGDLFASGRTDVKLWNASNHQTVRVLDMSTQPFMLRGSLSLDFSPSGRWLAAGTPAGSVWLWETSSWKHDTLPLMSYVMSLDFSPDSERLVAGDMWCAVKMWDVESRQTVATFNGSMAQFSPDGTLLAVGCEAHISSLAFPETCRVRLYYAPPLAALDAE